MIRLGFFLYLFNLIFITTIHIINMHTNFIIRGIDFSATVLVIASYPLDLISIMFSLFDFLLFFQKIKNISLLTFFKFLKFLFFI